MHAEHDNHCAGLVPRWRLGFGNCSTLTIVRRAATLVHTTVAILSAIRRRSRPYCCVCDFVIAIGSVAIVVYVACCASGLAWQLGHGRGNCGLESRAENYYGAAEAFRIRKLSATSK